MSSFVSLRSKGQSIRIGNPTFKLLLEQIKEKKNLVPSIARIAGMNPMADCIGGLNLGGLDTEDIKAFLALAEGTLLQTERDPLTKSGFNKHEDLIRFVEELKEQFAIIG